jgi:uncharacterized phage protein gp47/JayE
MSFFTPQGLKVRRAYEIATIFRQVYESVSNETPDWDRDTFLGALAVAFAEVEGETNEALQAVWDSFDPNNAQGQALDTHALLAGIKRQEATQSSVILTLTGTSGSFVPQGRVVEDDNGERWVTQSDVTIGGGGTVTVTARAENLGPIFAGIGEITNIVTPASGWSAVTNAAAAIPGLARQSDESLRTARFRALRSGAKCSFRGIEQALTALDFLDAVTVIHNPSSSTATIQGVTLPRNSFRVIVFPNTITPEEQDELREEIFASAPIGIESTGAVTGSINGYPVNFAFATAQTVNITLTLLIDTQNFAAPGVLTEVQRVLTEYVSSLSVGAAIRRLEICRIVARVNGVLSIETRLINGVDADLILNADRYPVAGTMNITEF